MISKKVQTALQKQIEVEGNSSQVYLSMASWAETVGMNGMAMFLFGHADEEREHMLKLLRFINERGGHATVPAFKAPPKTFKSVKNVFEQVLEHEIFVTKEINKVVDVTLKEKDYTTHNFMQWYVSEQIEEEALARSILDKLNLIGGDKSSLYLFDRELETMNIDSETENK